MPGKKHEIWFYEKIATDKFRLDRPEVWAGMRVMDGNTLKPAMEDGFTGHPSSEQIENLYKLAQEGKLVYFELANDKPFAVTLDERVAIDLDLAKPEPLEPLPENASNTEKGLYASKVHRYNTLMQKFEKNQALLDKLGAGFKEAVEAYNNTRKMETEQTQQNVNTATRDHAKELRRLENTDRFINEAFGPRPIESPTLFYEKTGDHGDFVFKHSEFEQQFAPNGYDLPADSKLTEQEVATINFAMTGARAPVEKFLIDELHFGKVHAQSNATNGFQMLVTGCFGRQRINQELSGHGVLDMTFKLGKEAVKQYNEGKPALLGENLADSVRNIKAVCTGYGFTSISQDVVAGARVIGRIQELFDKHEDLRKAANLSEKEQDFMRGYVALGKAYEQHLKSMIKLNTAAASGKKLSFDDKVGVLADAVLRRLVEKEFIKDNATREADPVFRKAYAEAEAQDAADFLKVNEWTAANPTKRGTAEQEKFTRENDLCLHSTAFNTQDQDHDIIYAMAREGMLEKMRRDLMQNPAIRAAAAKEPFEFTASELEKSQKLDALAEQAEATKRSWETSVADKQAWFESMKAMLSGNKPENWLNPKAAGDNNRLMIALSRYDKGLRKDSVDLVGLEGFLDGGINALENPSKETLDILHAQAIRGNLYYYDVAKDMPIRVGADGAQATVEQIKAPSTPTLWQKIANTITFGWAYADVFNPKPDKDPAAYEAILEHQAVRSAAAQDEAQQRKKQIEQAGMDPKQVEKPEQNKEMEMEEEPSQRMGRQLAVYNQKNVDAAFGRFAVQEEKYLPAGENTMGLTNEDIGVLGAIASGSTEISFEAKKGDKTIIFENKPDEYYSKIITNGIAMGASIPSQTAKSVLKAARYQVKKALENGDMDQLGKMIAQGLTQNNKLLASQTDLNDYYTVYAELGGRLLNIVEKNEALKEAFNKHLGENTNQINMAKAAKNISDLRVKILPVKERLVKAFANYETVRKNGAINVKRPDMTAEELSSLGQLCVIQHNMKLKGFNLAKTKYSNSEEVAAWNEKVKNNKSLENFRTNTGHIEVILDDVVAMATVFSDAVLPKKAPKKNQQQMQNTLNKENEMKNEPSKTGPTT